MTPVLSPDSVITDRLAYAAVREQARDRMIKLRATRRVRLGDRLVAEFENAETLGYQVQEMVYVEGITNPAEVAAEIEAYSRLLPTSHSLTATLFVELDDVRTVRDELTRLRGIQHALSMQVGSATVAATELPGPDEPGPAQETYSVHFLRFLFDDESRDLFRDPQVPAELVVGHQEYCEQVPLGEATRRSLLADLSLGAKAQD
ncbi:MAG: DUF3501 family protein [Mycobacteriales bacterium]